MDRYVVLHLVRYAITALLICCAVDFAVKQYVCLIDHSLGYEAPR